MGANESACQASSNHSDVFRGGKSYPVTLRFTPGIKRVFGNLYPMVHVFFLFFSISLPPPLYFFYPRGENLKKPNFAPFHPLEIRHYGSNDTNRYGQQNFSYDCEKCIFVAEMAKNTIINLKTFLDF